MVSLLPTPPSSRSKKTSSSTGSATTSSSTDRQHHQLPVPSSPTKKIKLNHLPDFSHQSNQMLLKNNKNILPDSIVINKKRLKPKKPLKSIPQGGPARQKPTKKVRSRWFFSFLIQVVICYLGLAYFYFCPKDPSSNPIVCRNLAQVHWALEPHLSPYLHQLNHQFYLPLQKRVNRKLKPLYEHYLIPTWSSVQPQLSFALRLSQQFVHQSGLLDQAHKLKINYYQPLLDHINSRYEQKLQPHIQFTLSQSKQVYTTLRNSRLIRTIKTYLPHLHSFILNNLIHPLRHTILPTLIDLYHHHLHPFLSHLSHQIYHHVVIDDNNLLKQNLRALKITYRQRLLRPIKKLNEIYVKPQITKIVLKLNEYQSRKTDSLVVVKDNHTTSASVLVPQQQENPKLTSTSTNPVSSEDFPDNSESSEAPSSLEEDHHPDSPSTSEPVISAQREWPALVVNEPTAIDEKPPAQDESDHEEDLGAPKSSKDHDDPDLELHDSEPEVESQQQLVLEEPQAPLIETDNLTVDVDEFMNEIDEEIALEKEQEGEEKVTGDSEPQLPSRYAPEEVAKERHRLETLATEGFASLRTLESSQMEGFLGALRTKRNPDNIEKQTEMVTKERTKAIETERKKVFERLQRWFDRAQTLETVSADETASKASLIISKSKLKFFNKLVLPHLNELDSFISNQSAIELEILESFWEPISTFAAKFQDELGFGLTWLLDASYYDWITYNQINADLKTMKGAMESVINGTWSGLRSDSSEEGRRSTELGGENTKAIPCPEFFVELNRVRKEVEGVYGAFEADLDRLLDSFLDTLPSTVETQTEELDDQTQEDHDVTDDDHLGANFSSRPSSSSPLLQQQQQRENEQVSTHNVDQSLREEL